MVATAVDSVLSVRFLRPHVRSRSTVVDGRNVHVMYVTWRIRT